MPIRNQFGLAINIAMLLTLAVPAEIYGSGLGPASRMEIIRTLTAEYATLKVPLPRGRKGLHLSSDGKIDEESLKHEIKQSGTALAPNVLVQITAVNIEAKEILFEINGGGIKKSKWYDHLEVGMGNTTNPVTQGNSQYPTGSFVELVFPNRIEEMTVGDLKNYLAPVLDFNPVSHIQTLTRPIPKEFQDAVQAKKAVVGMDRDTVLAAMGPPLRKVRETKEGVEDEDWIYGAPPMKITFVTFEGEEVIDVKEYSGGIRGEVQPPEADPRP